MFKGLCKAYLYYVRKKMFYTFVPYETQVPTIQWKPEDIFQYPHAKPPSTSIFHHSPNMNSSTQNISWCIQRAILFPFV